MEAALAKAHRGDYRGAVLMTKRMYDVMLDDDCLLGMTSEEPLLDLETTTGHFLNAVFCLYGNRFEHAVDFADNVLSHRLCPDALFVKARALYSLGRYDEAYDVNFQIGFASSKTSDKITDQKQYLFEAKLNEKLGNSNVDICKKLIKLCPECFNAYAIMRREAMKDGKVIEDAGRLYKAFNDSSISDEDFVQQLSQADSKELARFSRRIRRLSDK